jgi:hypothetical protein
MSAIVDSEHDTSHVIKEMLQISATTATAFSMYWPTQTCETSKCNLWIRILHMLCDHDFGLWLKNELGVARDLLRLTIVEVLREDMELGKIDRALQTFTNDLRIENTTVLNCHPAFAFNMELDLWELGSCS